MNRNFSKTWIQLCPHEWLLRVAAALACLAVSLQCTGAEEPMLPRRHARAIEKLRKAGLVVTVSRTRIAAEEATAPDAGADDPSVRSLDCTIHISRGLLSLTSPSALYEVFDDDLVHLRDIETIVSLHLSHTYVSDKVVSSITSLHRLEALDLSCTMISDEGLKQLCKLPALEELSLRHTGITDKGVAELRNLACLRKVDLSYTNITDTSAASLMMIPTLKRANLLGTKITAKGSKRMAGRVACVQWRPREEVYAPSRDLRIDNFPDRWWERRDHGPALEEAIRARLLKRKGARRVVLSPDDDESSDYVPGAIGYNPGVTGYVDEAQETDESQQRSTHGPQIR